MKLFRYEGYKVTISEEAMMLKPFRVIWERDKTKTKQTALLELGYIYFMCDPRSDYMEISDKDDRSKAIIEAEGMDNWKADRTVTDAMSFYEGFIIDGKINKRFIPRIDPDDSQFKMLLLFDIEKINDQQQGD